MIDIAVTFDLATIRARNALSEWTHGPEDRRALLAAYDRLAAAARKVTCWRCLGVGIVSDGGEPCPDCADLRDILEGTT